MKTDAACESMADSSVAVQTLEVGKMVVHADRSILGSLLVTMPHALWVGVHRGWS